MSESKEPKVTECWTWAKNEEGKPSARVADYVAHDNIARPAILMWKEDYDAMQRELEEYRQASSPIFVTANDKVEDCVIVLKERYDDILKELEELRKRTR